MQLHEIRGSSTARVVADEKACQGRLFKTQTSKDPLNSVGVADRGEPCGANVSTQHKRRFEKGCRSKFEPSRNFFPMGVGETQLDS